MKATKWKRLANNDDGEPLHNAVAYCGRVCNDGLERNLVAEGQHDDIVLGLLVAIVLGHVRDAKVVAGVDNEVRELVGQAEGNGEGELLQTLGAGAFKIFLMALDNFCVLNFRRQQETGLNTSLDGQTGNDVVVWYPNSAPPTRPSFILVSSTDVYEDNVPPTMGLMYMP